MKRSFGEFEKYDSYLKNIPALLRLRTHKHPPIGGISMDATRNF